jgi:hypothetical protein
MDRRRQTKPFFKLWSTTRRNDIIAFVTVIIPVKAGSMTGLERYVCEDRGYYFGDLRDTDLLNGEPGQQ